MGNHLFVIFAVLDVSLAVNLCINCSFFYIYFGSVSYSPFIVIMAISVAVCEIFSVKE